MNTEKKYRKIFHEVYVASAYQNVKTSTGKVSEKFVCVEVLRPSQPNGVMSSAVSLPNHTFTGKVSEKFIV